MVPAALIFYYLKHKEQPVVAFALNYIAIIPGANLLGFAGQELSRKLPNKSAAVLTEISLGSIIEIVLFIVLLVDNQFNVIHAAILGSILATLLLCLGTVFFFGGMKRTEQEYDAAVSEVGNNLLMMAGLGLIIPTAFYHSVRSLGEDVPNLDARVLTISRICAIFLIISFAFYLFFQVHTHAGIYNFIWEHEERRDEDRHRDLRKAKLTFTECVLALVISLTLVTLLVVHLVESIEVIVKEHGISEAFMGLILVPIVEKAAEHLTAVDEAYDDQMNYALSHVMGATIQTALFNGPLVILIGWGLKKPMNLNFELFMVIVLILSILVVGNFLKDRKSNYLEGALCIITYLIIAVTTFFYPNVKH